MIKNVKHAMANGEGCRVCYPYVHYNFILSTTILNTFVLFSCFFFRTNEVECQLSQVYGVLDVQRVAGNFHLSVHGLNIFVAQQVTYLKLSSGIL